MQMKKQNLIFFTQEYSSKFTHRNNVYNIIYYLRTLYRVTIISLYNDYNYPGSIEKHYVIGKNSRLQTLATLLKVLWSTRQKNTICFFHQGGLYPFVVFPFKIFLNYKLVQWKAHPVYDHSVTAFKLHITDRILTVSPSSYPIKNERVSYIGHGISDIFTKKNLSIALRSDLSVVKGALCGRLTPSKGVDKIIEFLIELSIRQKNKKFVFSFFGNFYSKSYKVLIKDKIHKANRLFHNLEIICNSPVDQQKVCSIYNNCDFSLNFTTTALDKSFLESLSCGCVALSTNKNVLETSLSNDIKKVLYSKSYIDLVNKLEFLLDDLQYFNSLRLRVSNEVKDFYNIRTLTNRIINEFNT